MARPASFNKKDNEKKKQSKRLEKQQRKEERKASGKSSFEDMLAYVDENGVITTTPPDTEQKEEVDIENIVIATPKKEEIEENTILKGRVEHFNRSKGYGFIKDMATTDKYFFHVSNALEAIKEGDIVFFEFERGQKGMNAVSIKLAK
ncbi:MAG: cold shock domain-containing protein [Prevotellaceae bacterium]|jgi:cold shock CspA family protein|nr:cold shock domain-containing protein [Prevotellaceae bacterium]